MTLVEVTTEVSGLPFEGVSDWRRGGSAVSLNDAIATPSTVHPRLLANATAFEDIKRRIDVDPLAGKLALLVLRQADDSMAAAAILRAEPGFSLKLQSVRGSQSRILSCAMAFRLTGRDVYAQRAREELLALAGLPNWNPSHFLDIGEACLAAAVGLDWLHDFLSPSERKAISRAIVDNALRISLDVPAGHNSWVDGDFNWNPVCHAGLTAGAIAVWEDEPEIARRVLDRAIQYVPCAAAAYAPDGVYPEGPSYWSYGTNFHILFIESLRSAFGTSLGFEQLPGFLTSADWLKQVVAPSGEDFNYADYHTRLGVEPALLWYAREQRRRDIAREELAAIESAFDALARDSVSPLLEFSGPSRLLPLALLYWDPTLPPDAGGPPPLPLTWVAGGHLPMAVLRSGWNDPRATYVAVKGGTPNGSHAHMDVGSFVLEADGVRWAIELGTESYDRMRGAKIDLWNYKHDSSRWSVFRCGPDGHNVIRFDDGAQNVDGFSTIGRAIGSRSGVIADLAPMYAGQVETCTRRIELHTDRSVTIEDAWQAGDRAVVASVQWLTRAAVAVVAGGVELQQDGATLHLHVTGPGDMQVCEEDVSSPRGAADSPNDGVRRIVFRCSTRARGSGQFIIRAKPQVTKPSNNL